MALGELKLVVGQGDQARSTSAVVSFSTAWVVTNSDDMIDLLRYFGHDDLLDSVRDAPASGRAPAWRHFWAVTDPNPQTPENEALDAYFTRLRIANERFTGEGVPGWRTDRGEVYITLGEPDETYDASAVARGRIIRWVYLRDQLQIDFTDDYGFGHFRMTPSSRAAYTTVLSRHRARGS
jgi:GWxTD domain-containing protein